MWQWTHKPLSQSFCLFVCCCSFQKAGYFFSFKEEESREGKERGKDEKPGRDQGWTRVRESQRPCSWAPLMFCFTQTESRDFPPLLILSVPRLSLLRARCGFPGSQSYNCLTNRTHFEVCLYLQIHILPVTGVLVAAASSQGQLSPVTLGVEFVFFSPSQQ